MRRAVLTLAAQADIAGLFAYSAETFGDAARRRYEVLVRVGITDVSREPTCPGSFARPELGAGLRTYHLRHCRSRAAVEGRTITNPRHLIAYLSDDERVLILRVLHDSMDLPQHLPGATR